MSCVLSLLIAEEIDNVSLKSWEVYRHTQYKILWLWRGMVGADRTIETIRGVCIVDQHQGEVAVVKGETWVVEEPGYDSRMKLIEGGDSCTVTPFRVCILQQMLVSLWRRDGRVMQRWRTHKEPQICYANLKGRKTYTAVWG